MGRPWPAPRLPVLAGALLVLGVMQSLREEPPVFSLLPAQMPPVCGLLRSPGFGGCRCRGCVGWAYRCIFLQAALAPLPISLQALRLPEEEEALLNVALESEFPVVRRCRGSAPLKAGSFHPLLTKCFPWVMRPAGWGPTIQWGREIGASPHRS